MHVAPLAPEWVRLDLDPSLLEREQTNLHTITAVKRCSPNFILGDDKYWRHADCLDLRARIGDALHSLWFDAKRATRFDACGEGAYVFRHETDPPTYKVHSLSCGDRLCPSCARHRALTIRTNLMNLTRGARYRFITLTIKADQAPLADDLTRLYDGFATLRRLSTWRKYIAGGAAFCEVKRAKNRAGWHAHLHLIADGKYFPHALLSHTWHAATGDSTIVHIRAAGSEGQVERYVTKYLTKPFDDHTLSKVEWITEIAGALKGRHTCMTFGTWRRKPLCRPVRYVKIVPVMSFHSLLQLARADHPDARLLLDHLWTHHPCSFDEPLVDVDAASLATPDRPGRSPPG